VIAGGAGRRIGTTVPVAVAAAWAVALVAQSTGNAALLHAHGHGSDGAVPLWLVVLTPPFWVTAAVFLIAWQVMVAAMMLPSSLPMIRLFSQAARRQERPSRVLLAFLGGYAAMWGAVGAAAFGVDVAIHRAGDAMPSLAGHAWIVPAAALLAAGAFQFTDLKDRCLDQCRHPGPFLMRHYRRGTRGAFDLGRRHGLFCIGCCWALMGLMLAVGVASLVWMGALAAVMYYERVGRHGRGITPVLGVALIAWGIVVAAHPVWLPEILGGVAS
jgi:predicted metal-binding membrane protein